MKKSSDRRGDRTPVRQQAFRRDAVEQIYYDAASSSSSSSAEDFSDSISSFMTPSLNFPDRISFRNMGENEVEMDLSEAGPSGTVVDNSELNRLIPDDQTSYRIGGGGDGEMDRICLSIGVSGPEGFAISSDVWEASKSKERSSSDIIDRVKPFDLDDINELTRSKSSEIGNLTELTRSELREIRNFRTEVDREVVDGGIVEHTHCIEQTPTILVNDDVAVAVGGGIKGIRPPLLKPPPSMKRPPIDFQGSSWDFLRHFSPKSETDKRPSSSSSSDEEEVETEKRRVGFLQSGDTSDEACSFTTNEGDSSSTVSNTSPIYASGGPIITSWQKGQVLGRGSFGSVYEAISGDGEFFAFKEVSLLNQGSHAQECIQQLEGEISLLSQLRHPNIVRYRGMATEGSNLYLFTELVTQRSLVKLYQSYKLSDSLVSLYTKQILDGLKYLHDSGFIHRDIKCANILVDGNKTVKLADFGLAKVSFLSKLNEMKSCKGTPFWMAPEVINPKGNVGCGTPADIWSLGCTVLEMLTSQIPYGNLEPFQALFRIGMGTLPEIPETLSQDARHFILKCLKVNPEERPTAAELLNHPFLRRPLSSVGSGESGSASPLPRRCV